MEILFISHKYPPSIGGMERQSYHLIEGMKAYTTVHQICFEGDEAKLKYYLLLRRRIKKMLQRHPCITTIHCNDGLIASIVSTMSFSSNLKLTATIHGLDIVFPNRYFQNKIVSRLRTFDHIYTVSNATKIACIQRGFDPSSVTTIANGVDHDIAQIPSDPSIEQFLQDTFNIDIIGKKLIVSIGRACRRKGFSWFIQKILPQLNENCVYCMIGPYEPTPRLQERIINLLPKKWSKQANLFLGAPNDEETLRLLLNDSELEGRAYHLGKLPFRIMMQCLSRANLFVMPNLEIEGDFEGFGLVALEACLRKAPVLAAGIEGITDAIHHKKNGLLLPSASPSDWIENINKIIYDTEESEQLGRQAQSYVLKHFSWETMVKAYFNAFQDLNRPVSVKDTKIQSQNVTLDVFA